MRMVAPQDHQSSLDVALSNTCLCCRVPITQAPANYMAQLTVSAAAVLEKAIQHGMTCHINLLCMLSLYISVVRVYFHPKWTLEWCCLLWDK